MEMMIYLLGRIASPDW